MNLDSYTCTCGMKKKAAIDWETHLSRQAELRDLLILKDDGIRAALNNLGVPQLGYPYPIAEAVRILNLTLCNKICPPCDIGENTECLCKPTPQEPCRECPDCGRKLQMNHIKPFCPACGTGTTPRGE